MKNIGSLGALLATCAYAMACAADPPAYPAKAVRVIVAFAPGGGPDLVARVIAQQLGPAWGQQIVVDNRPSAGGTVAGSIVAGAAPDGHTLMLTSSGFAGSAAL